MTKAKNAGILGVVGVALAFTAFFYISGSISTYADCVTSFFQQGSCSASFDYGTFAFQAAIPGVAVVLSLLSFAGIRSAFDTLQDFDSEFSRPAMLTGFVYAALAVIFVAAVIPVGIDLTYTYLGSGAPAASTILAAAYLGVAIAVLGGALMVVGEVGLLLGIWRLGGRYHNAFFRAAVLICVIGALVEVGVVLVFPTTVSGVVGGFLDLLSLGAVISAIPPTLVTVGALTSRGRAGPQP